MIVPYTLSQYRINPCIVLQNIIQINEEKTLFSSHYAMSEDGVKKSSNPWVSVTAGCIAGAIECLAVWPMEYIKTQLQLQKATHKLPYNGMIDGLIYTVRTTGFFSLYRGLSVTLVRHANAIQFHTYVCITLSNLLILLTIILQTLGNVRSQSWYSIWWQCVLQKIVGRR